MSWSITLKNDTTDSLDLMLWYFETGDWAKHGHAPPNSIAPGASATFSWPAVEVVTVGRIVYASDNGSIDLNWEVSPATDSSNEPSGFTFARCPSGDYKANATDLSNYGSVTYVVSSSVASPTPQVHAVASGDKQPSSITQSTTAPPAAAANVVVVGKRRLCPPYSGEWWCDVFPAGHGDTGLVTLDPKFRVMVETFRDAFKSAKTKDTSNGPEPAPQPVPEPVQPTSETAVTTKTGSTKGKKKQAKKKARAKPVDPTKASEPVINFSAALRRVQQSYLMYYAAGVTKSSSAHANLIHKSITAVAPCDMHAHPYDPTKAFSADPYKLKPSSLGIKWDHGDDDASVAASCRMWKRFAIGGNPVGVRSNHNMGNAVDITLSWGGDLIIPLGEYPNPNAHAPDTPGPHYKKNTQVFTYDPGDHDGWKAGDVTITYIPDPPKGKKVENKDLIAVARSYGLLHLWGDRPHYSFDGK